MWGCLYRICVLLAIMFIGTSQPLALGERVPLVIGNSASRWLRQRGLDS